MRENTRVCKYGTCDFLLRKNGCGSSLGLPHFCCDSRWEAPPLASLMAPAVIVRSTTEYCLLVQPGNPVRIRNNRPLLCFSQRACCIDWVFHALTGECSLIDPYTRINLVALFFIAEKPHENEGGMQVTPEEKKAWAEAILRNKYDELGRSPTKKDFDSATCAQIKAYLGPWPRALESAGLKEPKKRKDETL